MSEPVRGTEGDNDARADGGDGNNHSQRTLCPHKQEDRKAEEKPKACGYAKRGITNDQITVTWREKEKENSHPHKCTHTRGQPLLPGVGARGVARTPLVDSFTVWFYDVPWHQMAFLALAVL